MSEGGYKVPEELVEPVNETVDFLSEGGVVQREVLFDKSGRLVGEIIYRINKDGMIVEQKREIWNDAAH